MKTILTAMAAMLLLAACEPAPMEAGCAECEKMAMEANAAHKAKMAAEKAKHGKDCKCCKGGAHHH